MDTTDRISKDIFQNMPPTNNLTIRKDIRSRADLLPARILWTKGIIEHEEVLLEERELQISMDAKNPFIMRNETETSSILLDFGVELHGGIRILVWDESTNKGAKVRLRFGESAMEAMSELSGQENATNDHARRDMTVELGMMSMNQIGETGFRFLRIDLLDPSAVIQIKSITAVMVYKDAPYLGSFNCSDEQLNTIWSTGAYTMHLNMQDYIWDGIKRDRLVWVGDMHPEMLTVWAVFGEDTSVEKSLDFIRSETALPDWMNHMATYSMWYVIILYDWYMRTGKLEFLEKQLDYLKGLEKQLSEHIDASGQDITKEGRFLDWPSSDNATVTDAGVQALHYMAAGALKQLFLHLGEETSAARCDEQRKALRKYPSDYQDSKQAASLLVLAGLLDPFDTNEQLLKINGAEAMSTFMGYYILSARARAQDYTGCLDCIREYYGGMLQLGATTFWEDFDIKWMENAAPIDELPKEGEIDVHGTYGSYCYKGYRHSLCHGWASSVTPWLTENVLGITVVEPGCRVVKVEPHLGDLQWAEGNFPTPYGNIFVSHKRQTHGSIKSEIKAPDKVVVIQ